VVGYLAPTIGVVMTARAMDRIGKGIRGAPRDALVAPPEKGCADVSGCGKGLEAWARRANLSRESSVGRASIRPVEKSWACACKSRLPRPTFETCGAYVTLVVSLRAAFRTVQHSLARLC